MRIDIGPIRGERGASLPFRIEIDRPEDLIPQLEFTKGVPLLAEGSVTHTGGGYLVAGTVRAEIGMECARCLTPTSCRIEAVLHERFVPEEASADHWSFDETDRSDDEADEAHMFQGDILDLTDVVREQVLVSLPMKAVCSDDCAGICAKCGRKLREGPCDCSDAPLDIRLAPLAAWFEKNQRDY